MNCQDDLTSVDLEASAPGIVPSSSSGTTVSLYPYISLSGSHATNIQNPDSLQRILRPLDSREVVMSNDEVDELDDGGHDGGIWRGGAIDSQDDDDEILVHVKFSELVRIKSLLISTGGGRSSSSPRLAKIYVNRGPAGVSFSDDPAGGLKADQEMELLEVADAQKPSVEYPVRAARFANVSELDLYFANSRSGTHSRLYYLGFTGESRQLRRDPGERMTVGAETGMDSMVDGAREEKPAGQASVR